MKMQARTAISGFVISMSLVALPAFGDSLSDAVTSKVVSDHEQSVQSGQFRAQHESANHKSAVQSSNIKKAGNVSVAPATASLHSHPAAGANLPSAKQPKKRI